MKVLVPAALGDFSRWDALDDGARRAVVARVQQALGADYAALDALVGQRRLGGVRHLATGYELVLVPGGRFDMGISEAEERELLEVLQQQGGFPEASGDEREGWARTLEREVAGIARAARPVRSVTVAPFLCGRRHLGALPLVPGWRHLCEAEWEYVARAGSPRGWLLEPPLTWDATEAPERALAQESALGLFDLISWDGEGFPDDGWPERGGYAGAPLEAKPFAPDGSEKNAIARGGPTYEWASEVAGLWAFFAGARSNAYGKGLRAAITAQLER